MVELRIAFTSSSSTKLRRAPSARCTKTPCPETTASAWLFIGKNMATIEGMAGSMLPNMLCCTMHLCFHSASLNLGAPQATVSCGMMDITSL